MLAGRCAVELGSGYTAGTVFCILYCTTRAEQPHTLRFSAAKLSALAEKFIQQQRQLVRACGVIWWVSCGCGMVQPQCRVGQLAHCALACPLHVPDMPEQTPNSPMLRGHVVPISDIRVLKPVHPCVAAGRQDRSHAAMQRREEAFLHVFLYSTYMCRIVWPTCVALCAVAALRGQHEFWKIGGQAKR